MKSGTRGRGWAGFTLIEMMIVVVVLGLLVAVAFPSFMDSIRKGRRSDAFAALAAVQQAQERWRGNNASYTTTLSDINQPTTTGGGHYTISVSAPPSPATLATGYMAIATASIGSTQASDPQCSKLGVQVLGGNITYAGCNGCSDLTFTPTHACWAR